MTNRFARVAFVCVLPLLAAACGEAENPGQTSTTGSGGAGGDATTTTTTTWLIESDADRRFAAQCFEVAIAAAGRGGPPEFAAVRQQTLREVVAPCAAAVVG